MADNKDVIDQLIHSDSRSVFPDAPTNASCSPEAVNAAQPTAVADGEASEQSKEAAATDAECDAPDRRALYQELCDCVKSCTAPDVRSEKWGFLGTQGDLLRIDMPPVEFVAALEQDYSAEALSALGLFERVDEELRLASWLDGDAPLYVIIDADKFSVRFCRDSEFLFPMTRTAADYAVERIPPDSTQAPVTLFIVQSQDDVEVIQRLGLRAVCGEGLEALGGDDVQRLFSGDQRSDCVWQYYLLLVDFDVAGLKNRPSAAIGAVIARLADAADVYDIDPARRFGVCRPSTQEFQMLERAIAFQDAAQICQLFERWSTAAKSVRINSWRTHFGTEAASFSVARAALIRALRMSNDICRRDQVLAALPAYRAAGRSAVIEKFYTAIDSASDPFDKVDLIAATEYAEAFLDGDPLVRAGEAVLAGQIPPSARELHEELFEQRQRCMVELRRIRRDRKAKR
jgi:hypothetical protein